MITDILIDDYSESRGVTIRWSDGYIIHVESHNGSVQIRGNAAGLTSLAQHMLTLAQTAVPGGRHVHYSADTCLEDGSLELVIEKL